MAFPTTRCRRRDPRLFPLLRQSPASDLGVRARFDDPLHGQLDEVGLAVVPGGAWGTTAVFASPVPRPLPPSRTDSSAFSILWPPFRRLLKNGAFANGTGWMPIQLDR